MIDRICIIYFDNARGEYEEVYCALEHPEIAERMFNGLVRRMINVATFGAIMINFMTGEKKVVGAKCEVKELVF